MNDFRVGYVVLIEDSTVKQSSEPRFVPVLKKVGENRIGIFVYESENHAVREASKIHSIDRTRVERIDHGSLAELRRYQSPFLPSGLPALPAIFLYSDGSREEVA